MPEISVIIPSYNNGKYLSRSIESVFAQTYKDFEIIVVDDGSTDDTFEIAKKYEKKIIYFKQQNKGTSAAKNIGLQMAQGRYIQFLDADDIIFPEKLEKQIEIFNSKKDVDIVYSDYIVVDANGDLIEEATRRLTMGGSREGEDVLEKLVESNFIAIHSPLVKSELFSTSGNFDVSFRANEDWDVWMRLAICGFRYHYLPGVFAAYYKHGEETTRSHSLMHKGRLAILDKFSRDENFSSRHEELFWRFQALQNKFLADYLYSSGEWKEVRKHLTKAIKADFRTAKASSLILYAKTIAHQLLRHRGKSI